MANNRINHSICRWTYNNIPFEELCQFAVRTGIKSIELTGPDQWAIQRAYGLTCAMPAPGAGVKLEQGFNTVSLHPFLQESYANYIPLVSAAGYDKVICFSGNRNGLSDAEGLANCASGLMPLLPIAEKYRVTLVMELLNSKVDHPDYQCDHTAWGVALCERLNSPYFKLLYDIYHMQIMEGDIIRTIQQNIQHIAHFHTGGNPGRHEIDYTQEIYYPAIMRAIAATGYQGFVAQEFLPVQKDTLATLERCVRLCDVE
ncbi:MAG: TIM barrel protein [Verrucomicrobiota bacterium]|nr:TIM barrel protein [Verrucomicrobiota bacterium]